MRFPESLYAQRFLKDLRSQQLTLIRRFGDANLGGPLAPLTVYSVPRDAVCCLTNVSARIGFDAPIVSVTCGINPHGGLSTPPGVTITPLSNISIDGELWFQGGELIQLWAYWTSTPGFTQIVYSATLWQIPRGNVTFG